MGLSTFCVLQNAVDDVIEMYLELHMWDECIAVAEARVRTFLSRSAVEG